MNSAELDKRLELARANPGVAHHLLTVPHGQGPVCELCGGKSAPIIDGKHLNPDRWCEVGADRSALPAVTIESAEGWSQVGAVDGPRREAIASLKQKVRTDESA